MLEIMQGLELLSEVPGYKAILTAVIKHQIQSLVLQLADQAGEESVLISASVEEGTLTHLGSDFGKIFLDGREEIKSQFLGFCLKSKHIKQTSEQVSKPHTRKKGPYSSKNRFRKPALRARPYPLPVLKTEPIESSESLQRQNLKIGNQSTKFDTSTNQSWVFENQSDILDTHPRQLAKQSSTKSELVKKNQSKLLSDSVKSKAKKEVNPSTGSDVTKAHETVSTTSLNTDTKTIDTYIDLSPVVPCTLLKTGTLEAKHLDPNETIHRKRASSSASIDSEDQGSKVKDQRSQSDDQVYQNGSECQEKVKGQDKCKGQESDIFVQTITCEEFDLQNFGGRFDPREFNCSNTQVVDIGHSSDGQVKMTDCNAGTDTDLAEHEYFEENLVEDSFKADIGIVKYPLKAGDKKIAKNHNQIKRPCKRKLISQTYPLIDSNSSDTHVETEEEYAVKFVIDDHEMDDSKHMHIPLHISKTEFSTCIKTEDTSLPTVEYITSKPPPASPLKNLDESGILDLTVNIHSHIDTETNQNDRSQCNSIPEKEINSNVNVESKDTIKSLYKSDQERKTDLENYLFLDHTARPYPCNVCPKRFKERHHLVYHIRTHSGHKPYKCCICSKSFTQSSSLNTHKRTHWKDIQCKMCGQIFRKQSLFINHRCEKQ